MSKDYFIQSLILFLDSALKRGKLKKDFVETQKRALLEKKEVNEVIAEINAALPENEGHYPLYDNSSPVFEIKGQIFAFQHFLHGKLNEKKIKIENQIPLFRQATRLWSFVGDTIPTENGMKEFAALIEKTNDYLPENERYPTFQE